MRRPAATVTADSANGLDADSAAHGQQLRAVPMGRIGETLGNVGPTILSQVRVTLARLRPRPATAGQYPRDTDQASGLAPSRPV